jgi:hypothetical protein
MLRQFVVHWQQGSALTGRDIPRAAGAESTNAIEQCIPPHPDMSICEYSCMALVGNRKENALYLNVFCAVAHYLHA